MNKLIGSAFFLILAVMLIIGYNYIPTFITEHTVYSTLFNGIFLAGVVISVLVAIGIAVRGS